MSTPLRVLVDAFTHGIGGGGTVLTGQLAALARRTDIAPTALASPGAAASLAATGAEVIILRVPTVGAPGRVALEQLLLPRRARGFDVLYMPGNFAALRAELPQVVLLQNPHHFGAAARQVRRALLPRGLGARVRAEALLARRSVRAATTVLAVSETLAAAVAEDCAGIEVLVLPSAPQHLPAPAGDVPPGPYVLSVANDYFHKDWDGLARAFEERPELPPLVIAGRPRSARRLAELRRRWLRTTFLGTVSGQARLAALYAQASCYVAHSYLESTSLTPLEAALFRRPIAASDIPAHREHLVDAAAYYPLGDHDALAAAITHARPPQPCPVAAQRTWDDVAEDLSGHLWNAAARTGS